MKKKLVIITGTGLIIAGGSVAAWALLGGTVTVPDAVQGFIPTNGAVSCQSQGINFTIPDPEWNNILGEYAIDSLDYANISAACTSLGTADLDVNLTMPNNPQAIATGTELNLNAASGTMALDNPLPYDIAANALFYWQVRG